MKKISTLLTFCFMLSFTISCESDTSTTDTESLYNKIEDTLSPDTDDHEVDQRDEES